jgi:hypothetical protein
MKMNLEAIRELRMVYMREGAKEQEAEVNQLLKEGWQILSIYGEAGHNRTGRLDRLPDYLLLARLGEEPDTMLLRYPIQEVRLEPDVAQVNGYLQVGWRLLHLEDVPWSRGNTSGKTTSYVLGRPLGILAYLFDDIDQPTAMDRLVEGVHVLRHYNATPALQATRRQNRVLQIQAAEYAQLAEGDRLWLKTLGWTEFEDGLWVF